MTVATAQPDRSPRGVGREDDRIQRVVATLPFVLLGLSLAFSLAGGAGDRLPWIIAITSITVALRVWWQFASSKPSARVAGFIVNLLLTFVLICLSPVFGVYAFAGYLDAVVVFTGAAEVYALVAAASLNALAQSGGLAGVARYPWLFAFLVIANGGLAVVMVQVDRHRQRTVTRLEKALSDLEQAHQVNAELQAQLVDQAKGAGKLEERQRVSREIHDTVAQGLIALIRQIEAAGEAASFAEARPILDRADRTARDSLAEARRAVSALASPSLDQADLPQAIEDLVTNWADDNTVRTEVKILGRPVTSAGDADLFRVCQEALANVSKHSQADSVEVALAYGESLTLLVRDDGQGFTHLPERCGHGLRGMQDRLRSAGGHLVIDTKEGHGCTVTATIPL